MAILELLILLNWQTIRNSGWLIQLIWFFTLNLRELLLNRNVFMFMI
jgi:hypothetical protein